MRPFVLATLIPLTITTSLSFADSDIEQKLDALEKEIEKIRQQSGTSKESPHTLSLYGSLRPVLTYSDTDDSSDTDVQDALSRFGFTGSTRIAGETKAYFRGEWNIRVADGGQIDGARNALVGLAGGWGDIAIGKQRPPQYNLIGEHVDIFNHRASPYAYDGSAFANGGTSADFNNFFVDNSTVYKYSQDGFSFQAAARTNGGNGENSADFINAGISYKAGSFYIAYAYVDATAADTTTPAESGDEMTINALAAHTSLSDLYIAIAYQDINFTPVGADDLDRSSLDISLAYPLADYKIKLGYFDYDDGDDTPASQSFSGANLTLERQLASNIRVHTEYLQQDPEEGDSVTQLTLGIRYDFSVNLK